jgi:hypothetical protein
MHPQMRKGKLFTLSYFFLQIVTMDWETLRMSSEH